MNEERKKEGCHTRHTWIELELELELDITDLESVDHEV